MWTPWGYFLASRYPVSQARTPRDGDGYYTFRNGNSTTFSVALICNRRDNKSAQADNHSGVPKMKPLELLVRNELWRPFVPALFGPQLCESIQVVGRTSRSRNCPGAMEDYGWRGKRLEVEQQTDKIGKFVYNDKYFSAPNFYVRVGLLAASNHSRRRCVLATSGSVYVS